MLTLFFPVKEVLRINRSWIIMAAVIFFGGAVIFYMIGLTSEPAVEQAIDNQLEQLMDLLMVIMEANPVIGALLIFMNNFITMVQMLLLGVIAGISPLITLGLNGSFAGAVLAVATEDGTPLIPLMVFGLLPHGIFELAAFFICGGIGLKFGYHCIASPLPEKTRLQSFRYIWKEAISVLPLVVTLLLLAAFIEIMVTPGLLQRFL